MGTRTYTPAEVADALDIHVETARRWIRTGHLPAVNISPGSRRPTLRVTHTDLERFLKTRRPAA